MFVCTVFRWIHGHLTRSRPGYQRLTPVCCCMVDMFGVCASIHLIYLIIPSPQLFTRVLGPLIEVMKRNMEVYKQFASGMI